MLGGGRPWPPEVWQAFWQSLVLTLGLGAAFAFFVGLLALGWSQALRRWSAAANRWISTRRAARPLARPCYAADRSLRAQPMLGGVVIGAAALYSAAVLLRLVWG
jgi:hypothetical protein